MLGIGKILISSISFDLGVLNFCVNAILKQRKNRHRMTQEFDTKLIDQLLEGRTTPEDITGEHGLLKQLTKVLLERALQAEMTHHLGHQPHARVTNDGGNARNGSSKKTMQGEFGFLAPQQHLTGLGRKLTLEIPRDRAGSFEPVLIGKHERRFLLVK
jgi:putative transposase